MKQPEFWQCPGCGYELPADVKLRVQRRDFTCVGCGRASILDYIPRPDRQLAAPKAPAQRDLFGEPVNPARRRS